MTELGVSIPTADLHITSKAITLPTRVMLANMVK